MNRISRCGYSLLLTVASLLPFSIPAWADELGPEPVTLDSPGFSLLSDSTNVTHWGLGAGMGYQQSPYAGYGTRFTPIPLLYFDDKWVRVLGAGLDLKLGSWSQISVALRVKYALSDGYNQSDAPILNGMEDRKGAFWYGPALSWRSGYGTLTGDLLTSANKGEQVHITFSKAFQYGKLSIEPHVGANWLSHTYVNYYYGVQPSEALVDRPTYAGSSTVNVSVGSKFDYHFAQHQTVSLDIGAARFGDGITDSPLVNKKVVPQARLGYLYRFN